MTSCMSYGFVRIVGHDAVERRRPSDPTRSVGRARSADVCEIVLRQVGQHPLDARPAPRLVGSREMRDAAPRRVDRRAAERLGVDLLVRHRLHDVRAGDEHVARALDHDGEVGDRRRVDRAAGARAR